MRYLFAVFSVIAFSQLLIAQERESVDGTFYLKRGIASVEKGRYNQALVDFNKAIALNPNDALGYRDYL